MAALGPRSTPPTARPTDIACASRRPPWQSGTPVRLGQVAAAPREPAAAPRNSLLILVSRCLPGEDRFRPRSQDAAGQKPTPCHRRPSCRSLTLTLPRLCQGARVTRRKVELTIRKADALTARSLRADIPRPLTAHLPPSQSGTLTVRRKDAVLATCPHRTPLLPPGLRGACPPPSVRAAPPLPHTPHSYARTTAPGAPQSSPVRTASLDGFNLVARLIGHLVVAPRGVRTRVALDALAPCVGHGVTRRRWPFAHLVNEDPLQTGATAPSQAVFATWPRTVFGTTRSTTAPAFDRGPLARRGG